MRGHDDAAPFVSADSFRAPTAGDIARMRVMHNVLRGEIVEFCIRRNASRHCIWMPSSLKCPDADSTPLVHRASGRRYFSICAETQHRRNIFKSRRQSQRSGTYPRERRSISPLSRTTEYPSAARCRGYVARIRRQCPAIRQRLFVADSRRFAAQVAGGITSGHCSSCNSKC